MKFTIVTVNYNNKIGLEKTIKSVLSQTYKDIEYIIVDGGSTDGSREIIENYKENITWWCSESDSGVYNAMNKGIMHANGDYINFMNSGDCFYDDDVLSKIASFNPNADVLYGNWVRWYNSEKKTFSQAPLKISVSFFFRGDNICHQAMFVRSTVHRVEKYNERFRILADWDLWQRLAMHNRSFQLLPIIVCNFDANSGLSEKCQDILKAERKMIRSQYPPNLLSILQENRNMYNELKDMGDNFRRIFALRLKHPIYNLFLKASLAPMFLITKLFYQKES